MVHRRPALISSLVVSLLAALFLPVERGRASEGRRLVRRSATEPPKWTNKAPPRDARWLYFAGFTSGLASLEEARDQAVKKATFEIVSYFGLEGSATFVSNETQTESDHRYRVVLDMKFEGQRVTVRGIQLADSYHEEYVSEGQSSYDFFALIRYPVEEYEAVLAEKARLKRAEAARDQERAHLALEHYRTGTRFAAAKDYVASLAALHEALATVRRLEHSLPLDGAEVPNTALLMERIERTIREVTAAKNAVHRTLAAHLVCTVDGNETPCEATGALAEHVAAAGFELTEGTTSTSASFQLDARLEVTSTGNVHGIYYARASGSFAIKSTGTGKVVDGGDLERVKGAQLDLRNAQSAALLGAKRKLGTAVRKVLRKLE